MIRGIAMPPSRVGRGEEPVATKGLSHWVCVVSQMSALHFFLKHRWKEMTLSKRYSVPDSGHLHITLTHSGLH